MRDTGRCVKQIEKVLSTVSDPAQAYLIRTRLKRSILSCVRAVATSEGHPPPTSLDGHAALTGASPHSQHVLALCDSIWQKTAHVCQPSEPLESRWEAGWAEIDADLRALRGFLLA
jgi:hypothetical protein